jgi:hypothetical protein
MKLHDTMTPQKIVEEMRGEMTGQLRKLSPDGDAFQRVSAQEQAEAQVALQEILNKVAGVKFVCVGCGEPVDVDDAACCACGGFVCPACRAMEVEGECHHERHSFPDDEPDE